MVYSGLMNRPSKKDIKAALDKLKENNSGKSAPIENQVGKLTPNMSNRRPRKQQSG
jgi:hypothetical protein